METINASAAVLSNYEVKSLLQELRSQQKRTNTGSPLATIIYEFALQMEVEITVSSVTSFWTSFATIRYLQDTPCKSQTPEIITKFLKALEPFKLTKAEKVMLLNNPPTTALEIQLMVEESEERLTDEEVEQLLQIVVDSQLVSHKDDPEISVCDITPI